MTYSFTKEEWKTNPDQSEYFLTIIAKQFEEKPLIQVYAYSLGSANSYQQIIPVGLFIMEAENPVLTIRHNQPFDGHIVVR